MTFIERPIDIIIKATGKQKKTNKPIRLLTYTQCYKVDDGILLYNLMTRELILLQNDEITAYNNLNIENSTIKYLYENWFLVPVDFDDYKLFKQTDTIFRFLADSDKNPPITQFAIFPTTDCNARCFYCFEHGYKRVNMSEKTANDVVEFIKRKSAGKKINIHWFGGEPLYNSKAIDIITQGIANAGIEYSCNMVSNGYLFDEEMVNKAKNFWKLSLIQITLDGTEEVYNKTKAYIYKNISSPFQRVLNNIELLLKADIYVNIRLNMNMNNCEDLKVLIKNIFERFGDYENFFVYPNLLFDISKNSKAVLDDKYILGAKINELIELIKKYRAGRFFGIKGYRKAKRCMADNNASVTISPEGKLGKCDHFADDFHFGSIYTDEIDWKNINKFKEIINYGEKCHSCSLQPICYPLKACPFTPDSCDEFDKKAKIADVRNRVLSTYNNFKKYNLNNRDIVDEVCN